MMCCALWSPRTWGGKAVDIHGDGDDHGPKRSIGRIVCRWSHATHVNRVVMMGSSCATYLRTTTHTPTQATSRQTRLRSEKYEKNVTKRGNVPVGKAAVCVRRMHACLSGDEKRVCLEVQHVGGH